MLLKLLAMSLLLGIACARAGAFQIPEGWVVSPANDKAEGEAGYRVLHQDSGIELVYVPAGKFLMGSEEGEPDKRPVHEVELSAFWIGLTEVTVKQWRMAMGSLPDKSLNVQVNDQGDDHPVVVVYHQDCCTFCQNLGVRLPTEAEWE